MSICDERRRRGERIVLAAFAREHGIHADTLRPYIREDLSLRKPIHYVGQQKLINDGEMEEFCQRMVREYPELMPRDVILELISLFDIEAVQARNQFDKIVKRRGCAVDPCLDVLLHLLPCSLLLLRNRSNARTMPLPALVYDVPSACGIGCIAQVVEHLSFYLVVLLRVSVFHEQLSELEIRSEPQ